MIGEEKPSLEELRHYGVKGMLWRTRKPNLIDKYKGLPPGSHNRPMPQEWTRLHAKITDASQIVIPEGRRHHNAAIDKWLRDIKKQRLILESGKQKTNDILGTVGGVPFSTLPLNTQDNRG